MDAKLRIKHVAQAARLTEESGFTIIELMIATVVSSLLLLVMTYGILSFTHAYYTAVTRSTTQDTARSVINSVAQMIETSGAAISITQSNATAPSYFCAGNNIFVFRSGVEYQGGQPSTDTSGTDANLGLYVMSWTTSCPGSAPGEASLTNGRQLLSKGMRVAILDVENPDPGSASSVYSIRIRLLQGDDDLLCAPTTVANSCAGSQVLTAAQLAQSSTNGDITCRLHIGYDFCAVAELNTNVSLRVQSAE